MGKSKDFLKGTKCPKCGYFNQENYVIHYGTCHLCNEILDKKAKYNYEMVCRLRLWRNKKRGEKSV